MEKASQINNWYYNPKLLERARYLRKHATKSETYLWKFALKNKIMGHKFYRQRPVMNYIADFMCKELLLIIECDGITHQMPETAIKDVKRQKDLEAIGFTFLRFEDNMILDNLSLTLSILEQEIKKLETLNNPNSSS